MDRQRTFFIERASTPTGTMLIVTDDERNLRALDWEDHQERMLKLLRRHYGGAGFRLVERRDASAARRALQAYFDGNVDAVSRLPTETNGTAFQRKVWTALREIPAGKTLSYGALAANIGHPTASRAVGLANGSNPIAIAVPCHRVIGANHSDWLRRRPRTQAMAIRTRESGRPPERRALCSSYHPDQINAPAPSFRPVVHSPLDLERHHAACAARRCQAKPLRALLPKSKLVCERWHGQLTQPSASRAADPPLPNGG